MTRWMSKPKQIVKLQTAGGSLEKRLAKVEQELAQVEADERFKNCTCGKGFVILSAGGAERLRAEMDRLCPVHGFRELHIMRIVSVRPAKDSSPAEIIEEPRIDEALSEYRRRLAESRQQREEDD